LFGGGGGAGSSQNNGGAGGGGGGGSSYTTGTSTTNTAGSGVSPGNDSDPGRGGAGEGGTGGAVTSGGVAGTDGRVIIMYSTGGGAANEVRPELYWARISTNDNNKIVESANPGPGLCTDWCTDGDYNLPVALTGLS